MAWFFLGTTVVCGIGWINSSMAAVAACVILERHGIDPDDAEVRAAAKTAVRLFFSRRK